VEVPYSAYGHSPGTITLSLTQTVASGETDLRVSPHETMVTGAPVETYVLTVQYTPQDPIEVAYHTGEEGTKSPGPSAHEIESENTHIINVFAKQLRLRKTDMNQGVINYAGASFNLYRKAAAGESGQEVEGLTGTYVLIDTLVTDQGGLTGTSCDLKALDSGETYFLTETAAPPGFIPFAGAIAVQTSVRDAYEKVLENAVDGEEPIGFDWDQTASIVLANPTYAVLSGAQAGASQTYDQTTIEVTYDIMNSNGYALPHTGAAGTASYRVSGLMLILLASLTACFRARHGERRKKGL
jgi:LPXTG-motif cell wall-anchored protein